MRTAVKTFIFIFIGLAGISAAASGRIIGNGGDAVVCMEPTNVRTVHLFDYFEAKILEPEWRIDLGDGSFEMDKVKYVLTRLARLSPDRDKLYLREIEDFIDRNPFVDSELKPIDDVRNVVMPENCHLEQLAVRLNPAFDPYRRKLLINRKLFDLLPADDRAGLLLHEAIYAEAINLGQDNSVATRYFNALIASFDIGKMKRAEFVDVLYRVGFHQVEMQNSLVELFDPFGAPYRPEFFDNDVIKSARVSRIRLGSTELPALHATYFAGGEISSVDFDSDVVLSGLTFMSRHHLEFYQNQKVHTGCLAKPADLESPSGVSIHVSEGTQIELDQSGRLIYMNNRCRL